MWPFSRKDTQKLSGARVFFTNTLTGKKEPFSPLRAGTATMYSCGPTVYSRAHIGNLRAYVFADLVARVLIQAGYRTRRVINITDVGHLVSDADEGEDKVELGAQMEGVSAKHLTERYTHNFIEDIRALNLNTNDILFPRATEYIKEQLALIKELEQLGHTYRIKDGIYFDVSTFPGYGKLGDIPKEPIQDGSAASLPDRITLAGKSRIGENPEKRQPADFALWKFSPKGAQRHQEWNSPWGLGFPGWHTECSAMAKALLGETLDIHTGGIDHIPTHHNGEIAQSESATGKPLARYWLHGAFLTMESEKVSKSLGNVVLLTELSKRGIHPLALRYLFLQAHYSSPLSFSWEALQAAREALARLWRHAREIRELAHDVQKPSEERDRLIVLLRDDLATPQALALLWDVVKDERMPPKQAWGVICAADEVLALSLTNPPHINQALDPNTLPSDIRALIEDRETARSARNFPKADELRAELTTRGYHVEDTVDGPLLTKSRK